MTVRRRAAGALWMIGIGMLSSAARAEPPAAPESHPAQASPNAAPASAAAANAASALASANSAAPALASASAAPANTAPQGASAAPANTASPAPALANASPPAPASAPANAAAANAAPPAPASAPEDYEQGRALFSGTIDLQGRIYTHVADMPPTVVRCANCHAVADGPEVPRSRAPRLTHDLLVRPRARRGGPPSNYDRNGFCTLLRRGVDPAFVLISVEMPRYTIDDANCRALWQYLTGSGHEANDR